MNPNDLGPTGPEAAHRFALLPEKEGLGRYNFEHFGARDLVADLARTINRAGIRPGEEAPDFEVPLAGGGGTLRLSDLRGGPVLLHFGSVT